MTGQQPPEPQWPGYPPQRPYQYPGPPSAPPAGWTEPMDAAQAHALAARQQLAAPVLVTIGDIVCTRHEVITPSGRAPIGAVAWSFTDLSRTTRGTPNWAIVCAVVFFLFCLLGLLFLLAKEERTQGVAQIVVQGPGLLHYAHVPVHSVAQRHDLAARVNYAGALTASASAY